MILAFRRFVLGWRRGEKWQKLATHFYRTTDHSPVRRWFQSYFWYSSHWWTEAIGDLVSLFQILLTDVNNVMCWLIQATQWSPIERWRALQDGDLSGRECVLCHFPRNQQRIADRRGRIQGRGQESARRRFHNHSSKLWRFWKDKVSKFLYASTVIVM